LAKAVKSWFEYR